MRVGKPLSRVQSTETAFGMKLQLVFVAKLYCCTKERAEFRFQFAVFRSECFLPLLSFVPLIQKRGSSTFSVGGRN